MTSSIVLITALFYRYARIKGWSKFRRQADPKRPGRRAYFLISLFAVLLVLFPFLLLHGAIRGSEPTAIQIIIRMLLNHAQRKG